MESRRIFGALDRLPCRGRSLYAATGFAAGEDDLCSAHHEDIVTRALAYKDTKFGFRLVRHLVRNGLPFPAFDVWDEEVVMLKQAYDAERGMFHGDAIRTAHMLASPVMRSERAIVEAALLSAEINIKKLSADLGLREEELRAYERLYFNVLDRGQDNLYLNGVAYPETGVVELMDGYVKSASFDKLLLRAGYKNGVQDMFWLAGLRHNRAEQRAAKAGSVPAKLEALIMTKGYILANNGFGTQSSFHAPAVSAARGLIAAAKQSGTSDSGNSDSDYTSLAKVVADEMRERMRQTALVREQLKLDRNAGLLAAK